MVESRKMGFAPEGTSFLHEVLRNSVYKQKIRSPIREGMLNAWDSHKRAGCEDKAFEITVPTSLVPVFKIRDFGNGLSKDDVFHYFGNFGASQSRLSNDFHGMFGLGNKSFFAYTNSYTVISYFDGQKMTFCSFINQENEDVFNLVSTEKSIEASGMEISFSVDSWDTGTFAREIIDLSRYFPVKPILIGATLPAYPTPFLKGTGWACFNGTERASAIMGKVGYSIDYGNFEGLTDKESCLLRSPLELYFNIGELKVTASREDMQYVDSVKLKIKERLAIVIKEIQDQTDAQFKACKTLIDAKILYSKIYGSNGSYGNRLSDVISGDIEWNGQKINDATIQLGILVGGVQIHRYTKYTTRRSRVTHVQGMADTVYRCEDNSKTFVNDNVKENTFKGRAETLFAQDSNLRAIQVISFSVPTQVAFEAYTGMSLAAIEKYSTVAPMASNGKSRTNYGGRGTNVEARKKHTKRAFLFNKEGNPNNYRVTQSDYWTVTDLEVDGEGVYVVVDHFVPVGYTKNRDFIHNYTRNIQKAGIVLPSVYGVKAELVSKLGAKWMTLDTYVKGEIVKKIASNGYVDSHTVCKEYGRYDSLETKHIVFPFKADEVADQASVAARYTVIQDIAQKGAGERELLNSLFTLVDKHAIAVPKSQYEGQYENLRGKLFKTYPLLRIVESTIDKNLKAETLRYINGINEGKI